MSVLSTFDVQWYSIWIFDSFSFLPSIGLKNSWLNTKLWNKIENAFPLFNYQIKDDEPVFGRRNDFHGQYDEKNKCRWITQGKKCTKIRYFIFKIISCEAMLVPLQMIHPKERKKREANSWITKTERRRNETERKSTPKSKLNRKQTI